MNIVLFSYNFFILQLVEISGIPITNLTFLVAKWPVSLHMINREGPESWIKFTENETPSIVLDHSTVIFYK